MNDSNQSIESLIAQMRRLAHRRISEAELDRVADEIRAHLDASIQARLELGLSPEDATSEAISSFGNPDDFVEGIAENSGNRSLVDIGVCLALFFSIVSTAITFPLSGKQIGDWIPFGVLIACPSLVAWRSWKATRPQIIPLIGALLLGIPIYGFSYSIIVKGAWRLHWASGFYTSVPAAGCLAFFSLGSWFLGALVRGDIQRGFRRSLRNDSLQPLRWRHVSLIGALCAITAASFLAEFLTGRVIEISSWSVFSLIVTMATAIVIGWRSAAIRLEKALVVLAISIPLAAAMLSPFFLVLPGGEIVSRLIASEWIRPPGAWLERSTADLNGRIETQRQEFKKHGPPYRVQVTGIGPARTIASRSEAERLLTSYQQRELAKLEKAAPFIERSDRQWDRELATPAYVHGFRMLRPAAFWGASVWIIVVAAQSLAAILRVVFRRRRSRAGFA